MIENYRSRFLWNLMKQCPYLGTGLQRAGDGCSSAVEKLQSLQLKYNK